MWFAGRMEAAPFDLDLDLMLVDPSSDLMLSGSSSADLWDPFILDTNDMLIENLNTEQNELYTITTPITDDPDCLLNNMCLQLDAQEDFIEEHSYASARS